MGEAGKRVEIIDALNATINDLHALKEQEYIRDLFDTSDAENKALDALEINFGNLAEKLELYRSILVGSTLDWLKIANFTADAADQETEEMFIPEKTAEANDSTEEMPVVWESHAESKMERRKGFYGLMHIICPECGHVKDFGVKKETPISTYRCDACQTEFGMYDVQMKKAYLRCTSCGKYYFVQTNATGSSTTVRCKDCGAPIDTFWNGKKRQFESEEENT